MTLLEQNPPQDEILDFINSSVQQLQAAGLDAKYILVGREAYERLGRAIADRFHREVGSFETYNFIPIVVDPARSDTVCVLPSPKECAKGVQLERLA